MPHRTAQTEPGQTTLNAVPGGAFKGVVFLTGIFLVNFMSRLVLSPLFPVMERGLGFSHAQAGSIFLAGSVGYCLGLLMAGWVSSKLNHRRNIMLSIFWVGGAFVLMAAAQSLDGLRLGSFMAGVSGGIYLPSGIASLTSLVPRKKYGWAMGIHELAPNLGFITVPLLAEGALLLTGWRGAPGILALATALLAVAFWRCGRASDLKGEPLNLNSMGRIARNRSLWGATIGLVLAVGASIGSFSMLPLFLVFEHGFDQTTVNLLLALTRLACLVTAFSAGMLSDRLGAFRALAIFAALTGVLTILLGQVGGIWVWVLLFAQPAVTVCMFPAIFTFISLSLPPESRNLGVCLATGCSSIVGAGLIPIGIGYLGELGRFGLGFSLMGIITLAGLLVLYWLGGGAGARRS